MARSLTLAVSVLTAGIALALAGPVSASDIVQSEPSGDVRASGLTPKERKALDVVSARFTGEPGLGLVVTVTFRGNITNQLGKGGLEKALVALVIEPKSPTQAPSAIVTQGAGPVGETLVATSSETVGVVRRGRTLTYFLMGPGLENVGKISVKTFVRPPTGSSSRAPLGSILSPAFVDLVVLRTAADLFVFAGDFADAIPCERIVEVERQLDELLAHLNALKANYAKVRPKTPPIRLALMVLRQTISDLEDARDAIEARADECQKQGALIAACVWAFFGPPALSELAANCLFSMSPPLVPRSPSGSSSPIDAVRVVLPARAITNFLCPLQLPVGALSTTTSANDTLTCSGGALAVGQAFGLNVRMSPAPAAGMGGQLFGRQDGVFRGTVPDHGPLMRRLWILALGALLALGLAAPTSASDVSKPDQPGDVRATGLTAKERDALDIRSVSLTGEGDLGVFVTVVFKGNLQERIGKGGLRDAFVALVLQPNSTAQSSSVLVTRGPGPVGELLSSTSSTDVGVIRESRKLTFFIVGAGLENVASVAVKAFRSVPAGNTRAPQGAPGAELFAALRTNPADGAKFVAEQVGSFAVVLGCAGLDRLQRQIQALIAKVERLRPKADTPGKRRAVENALGALRKAEEAVNREIAERCSEVPSTVLGADALWSPFPGIPSEAVLTFGFKAGYEPFMLGATVRPADAYSPLDGVRVVLSSRQVTNFLCPLQLPVGAISTTTSTNDTLTCTGGTIVPGQQLQLNVRMTPAPTTGMGGQLFGRQDGVYKGPFQISGP